MKWKKKIKISKSALEENDYTIKNIQNEINLNKNEFNKEIKKLNNEKVELNNKLEISNKKK